MEQRLANTWRMTVNEKKFIETALKSDLRIDGRRPFDYRVLSIKFGREDGSSEVQLGQTHVMGFVTAQLVQPYRDRPNEGTLSIYTEFSPMADPSFEVGRPGEAAVELGRIIDRGLRESRAVDTESLCVLAGKLVWSIRIDLHIIDNGGNLVDASNIAALAALLTFRRPECTLGGDDGQEVIIHPPEVKDPIPLIIHHLPIAITFAFFGDENTVVVDPTHNEEAIMGGRMTATLNTNGDVCAIQKGGGVGVLDSVIMQCLRIASVKAADITSKIKKAVELLDTERALRKIKLHIPSVALDICGSNFKFKGRNQSTHLKGDGKSPSHHIGELNLTSEETGISTKNDIQSEAQSSEQGGTTKRDSRQKNFTTSSWDPYSKGVDVESLKSSLASHGVAQVSKQEDSGEEKLPEVKQEDPIAAVKQAQQIETVTVEREIKEVKTLKDAVKPKSKRKKNHQAREVN